MNNLVDTALDAGKFTILLNAMKAASLTETLRGQGSYTVFAPTDEAFKRLAPGARIRAFTCDPPAQRS